MTTKDFTDEIAVRAFINAQILGLAQKSGRLKEAKEEIIKRYNLDKNYSLQDHSWFLSLLYCLLVVPKELFSRNGKDKIFDDIKIIESIKLFNVTKGDNNHKLIIRAIRNAVSHARFECDAEMNFIFKDNKPNHSETYFECSITKENLLRFLEVFGALMANNRF